MREGELLFVEATTNTEQGFNQERIVDVMYAREPIEKITQAVMNMRNTLRNELLMESEQTNRDKLLEEFNEKLHDFHVAYVKGLIAMSTFEEHSSIKALPFLSWYTKYSRLFGFYDGKLGNFEINKLDLGSRSKFDVQKFMLSGWDVFIYPLTRKPEGFELVEILDETSIEETDWDGTKTKTGKEIIRRNGECGSKVFLFVYIESETVGRRTETVLHFYSISEDGKDVRHYQNKERE